MSRTRLDLHSSVTRIFYANPVKQGGTAYARALVNNSVLLIELGNLQGFFMCKECHQHQQMPETSAVAPGYLGVAKERRVAVDTLATELGSIHELELPGNKSERNILKQGLQRALEGQVMTFYVGSCPDYSNDGVRYTHESLGDGVPLLTRHHIEVGTNLVEALKRSGVNCTMKIMVADVEAVDDVFCERFTNGDEDEFIERCIRSMQATAAVLPGEAFKSSSFFNEFGRERFLEIQNGYLRVLARHREEDNTFGHRVMVDTLARDTLYRRMYPRVYSNGMTTSVRNEFLIERTMRTMAQYLTLGRLIGEEKGPVAIINHPTTNSNMFNKRGRFLLESDDPRYPQPTVPIFTMTRRVY